MGASLDANVPAPPDTFRAYAIFRLRSEFSQPEHLLPRVGYVDEAFAQVRVNVSHGFKHKASPIVYCARPGATYNIAQVGTKVNGKGSINVKSAFSYYGGKGNSQALRQILPLIPSHEEYREPFAGSAAVFFAVGYKAKRKWINDKWDLLINFYKVLQSRPLLQHDLIPLIQSRKFRHKWDAKEFRDNYKPNTDVEMAYYFYIVQKTSFSNVWKAGFPTSERRYRSLVTNDTIQRLIQCHRALQNTEITCNDFSQVIEEKGNSVFQFIDPPYKNAREGYAVGFTKQDHLRLRKSIQSAYEQGHRFLLTYDNAPFIKSLYQGYNQQEHRWNYSAARDTTVPSKKRTSTELFIDDMASPYTLPSTGAMRFSPVNLELQKLRNTPHKPS